MRQARANEIMFVKDSTVLYNVFEFHQQSILHKFCLKKTQFIYWTIEETLKANIPKEVLGVFSRKEILFKLRGEV